MIFLICILYETLNGTRLDNITKRLADILLIQSSSKFFVIVAIFGLSTSLKNEIS